MTDYHAFKNAFTTSATLCTFFYNVLNEALLQMSGLSDVWDERSLPSHRLFSLAICTPSPFPNIRKGTFKELSARSEAQRGREATTLPQLIQHTFCTTRWPCNPLKTGCPPKSSSKALRPDATRGRKAMGNP